MKTESKSSTKNIIQNNIHYVKSINNDDILAMDSNSLILHQQYNAKGLIESAPDSIRSNHVDVIFFYIWCLRVIAALLDQKFRFEIIYISM